MQRIKIFKAAQYNTTFLKSLSGLIVTFLITVTAHAQSGATGMQNATNEVKGYFTAGTNLMYAIGAIVGIVGAIKVYNKWNSGDQDTGKVAASWFGSCIFLIVVTAILKGFFGVA